METGMNIEHCTICLLHVLISWWRHNWSHITRNCLSRKIWSSTLLSLLLISGDVGWQRVSGAKGGHFEDSCKKTAQLLTNSFLKSYKICDNW